MILGKLPPLEKGGQPWIAEFEVQTVQKCEKWEKFFPNGSSECNSPVFYHGKVYNITCFENNNTADRAHRLAD